MTTGRETRKRHTFFYPVPPEILRGQKLTCQKKYRSLSDRAQWGSRSGRFNRIEWQLISFPYNNYILGNSTACLLIVRMPPVILIAFPSREIRDTDIINGIVQAEDALCVINNDAANLNFL